MKKILIIGLLLFLAACQSSVDLGSKDIALSLDDVKKIALSHGFIDAKAADFLVEELVDADPSYYLLIIKEDEIHHTYKIDSHSGKIIVSSNLETIESIEKEKEKLITDTGSDDVLIHNEDTPKIETPKTETPKAETPKTETPKDEAPKAETPKAETPKTETSKPSTPKAEKPKEVKNVNHDQALDIALKDAGFNRNQITRLEIENIVKKNVNLIEVEFYSGDYEYEYYVRISDGFILKKEIEYKKTPHNNNPISLANAKEMALKRVSGANDNHIVKIKEDTEDGRKVFEGKIIYNNFEYEFEIDANSGIFMEWEMEYLY